MSLSGVRSRAQTEAHVSPIPEKVAEERVSYSAKEEVNYADNEDGGPTWPSEEEESAFWANEGATHSSSALLDAASSGEGEGNAAAAERPSGPLPRLETLREQVPPEVLGLMEELFRAKLTRVVRVPETALKTTKALPVSPSAPADANTAGLLEDEE